MAELLYTYDNPPAERHLAKACQVLANDGVLAFCTDMNWAFACDASNQKSLNKIRRLKPHHPKEQPFSLICCDISMAASFSFIENSSYRFLRKAWPGPFTVILRCQKTLFRQLKDNRKVVGMRVPDSDLVLALIRKYGKPLATTSTPEIDGEIARFGYEIQEAFGQGVDLILDLGKEAPGLFSTIIDFTEEAPQLIRSGAGDPKVFDL